MALFGGSRSRIKCKSFKYEPTLNFIKIASLPIFYSKPFKAGCSEASGLLFELLNSFLDLQNPLHGVRYEGVVHRLRDPNPGLRVHSSHLVQEISTLFAQRIKNLPKNQKI